MHRPETAVHAWKGLTATTQPAFGQSISSEQAVRIPYSRFALIPAQSGQAGLNLSNEDQYDLLDIVKACHNDEFWVTVHEPDAILGSIGLLTYGRTGVLKKFILAMPYRGNDVPAIATRSRACYERNGLQRAAPGDLPACYRYPERDSFLYRLRLVLPS